ncbi:MAG: hypothetical protein WBM69_02695 [Desulfobacterales bacterium]
MSILFAIATVGGKILSNEKVKEGISLGVNMGIEKLHSYFDKDGDGDVDQDDLNLISEYAHMLVSTWGQAAMADGVTEECEEESVCGLIGDIIFGGNDPVFHPDLLQKFGIKKKELKKSLWTKFEDPEPLNLIAKYAEDKELEEIFYSQACAVIYCDKEVNAKEREFLDKFAKSLDLLNIDIRRIEKEYLP